MSDTTRAQILQHPELGAFVEALQRLCRTEHRRLAQACLARQVPVTAVATAAEVAAYNRALRDVAALLEDGTL